MNTMFPVVSICIGLALNPFQNMFVALKNEKFCLHNDTANNLYLRTFLRVFFYGTAPRCFLYFALAIY